MYIFCLFFLYWKNCILKKIKAFCKLVSIYLTLFYAQKEFSWNSKIAIVKYLSEGAKVITVPILKGKAFCKSVCIYWTLFRAQRNFPGVAKSFIGIVKYLPEGVKIVTAQMKVLAGSSKYLLYFHRVLRHVWK